MKKATPFRSLFKALTVLALASSCAKTNYDGRLRLNPLNKLSTPPATQQGNPAAPTTPTTRTDAKDLPNVSFAEPRYPMVSPQLTAQPSLQLSKASSVPVQVKVDLYDVDAMWGRDYNGFQPGKERSVEVVIPPGQTSVKLPVIGGRERSARNGRCASDFIARIDAMKLKDARTINDSTTIVVPCVTEPPPPPAVVPNAAYEKSIITVEPAVNNAVARIILDQPTTVDVAVNIQTQTQAGQVGVTQSLKIPAGSTVLDVSYDIQRADICAQPPTAESIVTVSEFNVVVTDIKNALMAQKIARVIVKDDNSRCKQNPPPPPPPVLPKARFENPSISAPAGATQATARILLDKPWTDDVIITIQTQDEAAKGGVDYQAIQKTITIPKGETSVPVAIDFIKRDKCAPPPVAESDASPAGAGGEFLLVVTDIKNADMDVRKAAITIAPDTSECKPVTAAFESTDLTNDRDSSDVKAKINLSAASDKTVVLDVSTEEGTAKKGNDFVYLARELTIPAGQTSIEIPLKVVLSNKCIPASEAGAAPKQFTLVVSKIQNATMAQPVATVTVTSSAPTCPPPPPVNSPAPKPPVNSPAPKPPVNSPAPTTPPPVVNSPAPTTPPPVVNSPAPTTPPPATVTPDPTPTTPPPVVNSPAPTTPPPATVTPDPTPTTPPPVVNSPAPTTPPPATNSPAPKKSKTPPVPAPNSPKPA
ncbi:MAG: Calx-beta domain-containing protein [Pseudobdellovibrio sp.]